MICSIVVGMQGDGNSVSCSFSVFDVATQPQRRHHRNCRNPVRNPKMKKRPQNLQRLAMVGTLAAVSPDRQPDSRTRTKAERATGGAATRHHALARGCSLLLFIFVVRRETECLRTMTGLGIVLLNCDHLAASKAVVEAGAGR